MLKIKDACLRLIKAVKSHKIICASVAAVLTVSIATVTVFAYLPKSSKANPTDTNTVVSETVSSEEPIIETPEVSEAPISSAEVISTPSSAPVAENKPAPAPKPTIAPPPTEGFKYNTNIDTNDNVFIDALVYTGYNLAKHRADGNMWKYILAANKRGMGYLSNITYNGGSTGLETLNGRPDIAFFEKHGLVCASYATYVYFNYLPNVAGIDTSSLPMPDRTYSANSWYTAAKKWVELGYSRRIGFTVSKTSAGFLSFKPYEDIPIGSLIIYRDTDSRNDNVANHVSIYMGYENNYHWITHVGNKNGPEFCAVQRMNFGPHPQWPIAIITAPSTVRMSALLELNTVDNLGNPISSVSATLTSAKNGSVIDLGASNEQGKLSKEYLTYGEYTLSYTVPEGYTADLPSITLSLNTANNSHNAVTVCFNKIPEPEPIVSEPTVSDNVSSEEATESSSEIQESSTDLEQ